MDDEHTVIDKARRCSASAVKYIKTCERNIEECLIRKIF